MMMITSAAGRRLAKAGHELNESIAAWREVEASEDFSDAVPQACRVKRAEAELRRVAREAADELIEQNMHEQLGD